METKIGFVCTASYHLDHPSNLIINDNNKEICLACMIDLCSDKLQPNVKKQYFMNHLLEIFKQNRSNILFTFQTSPYETEQIISVFLNLISYEDVYLSNLSSEGIILILSHTKHSEVVDRVVNTICDRLSVNHHFQLYLPFINLAANLLNKFPSLVPDFISKCEKILDNITSGLCYPNESVKKSVVNFFIQICKRELEILSCDLKSQLIKGVVKVLKDEQNGILLCNAMSLIKILIKEERQLEELFEINCEGATFPLLLKKMLLCQDTQLQIESCQTLLLASNHKSFDATKADFIMQCDVLEILFEILATQNINLIESIFNCIQQFCNYKNFFINCHVIFGINPIFRCIEQLFASNSVAILPLALIVLKEIFSRNSSDVTLFSNSQVVLKTISILSNGINSSYRNISLEATCAFQFFLKKEYMHCPIPLLNIQNIIKEFSTNLANLFTSYDFLMPKVNKGFISRDLELPEKLLIAKLSVINAAIRLLQDCISDASYFEETFKPSPDLFEKLEKTEQIQQENSCVINEFISMILETLYNSYIPVLYKYSRVFNSLKSFNVLIQSLIKLEEFSPKVMQEYFTSLCKMHFLEWLWGLRRCKRIDKNPEMSELKTNCNHLLKIILTNLTYNFDETIDAIPIFDLTNLNGNLDDETFNLLNFNNSLWVDSNKLTVSYSTTLAVLYFNKLHSNSDVVKPNNLLEILSSFIQNHRNLECLPHFTHKHLLFLYASSFEESTHIDSQKSRLVEPIISILSQLLQSYFLPLKILYTHHELLLKWILSIPLLANILGPPMLAEYIKHVEPVDGQMKQAELSILKTLLLSDNEFCISTFLDLLNSFGFSTSIWTMLNDLFLNMSADLQCKTRSVLTKKFCDLCVAVKGQKMDENTEKFLLIILKLITHLNTSENELLELKISQNVCSILPEIANCDLIMICYHYLNKLLTICCENNDNKVITMILSRPNLMEHLYQMCLKEKHSAQYLSIHLLADLIHYQFRLKTQVHSSFNIEFKQLQNLILSEDVKVIQSAVNLTESLLETSFNSPITHIESLFNTDDSEFNSIRLLYFYLQNTAIKVDEVVKELVFKCMNYLLTFAQKYNADLGSHLMCQPWIGVLFESQLRSFLHPQCLELRKLFYLFLEFPMINKSLLGFISKLNHHLTNDSSSIEKDLTQELFAKLSRSTYNERVKSKIEAHSRSTAVEE